VQLMGGRLETVFSLPGAGDLYVTCQGGRNSRMGRLLGMGIDPEEATERMHGETVEGVDAVGVIAPAVEKLIARAVLRPEAMPLLRQIYAVAHKGQPTHEPFANFFRQSSLELQPVQS
jgi:glycerol-3-phosphate dehydrogenase (NAD(P)+)